MTRDDIIKLAQEACDTDKSEPWDGGFWIFRQESIERFYRAAYAAGAAAEREACAKVCDDLELPEHYEGTWPSGWSDGTDDCTAAIRARGET